MGGRIGLLTQTSLQAMPSASGLVTQAVPANGQWQTVLTGLNACYAFELLACAQGPNGSKNKAMVHAIILTTFSGKPCSIRCTHTYQGWNIFRRMRVKWKKSATGYDLLMRSGHDFGKDENGKPVQIQFHLSRLW
ncbi:MAG: hypothetical protein KGM99_02905, partial [Burkholderiales bacterium]|nr:hypothetical protein [Burkholderiales bacterium]